MLKTRLCGVFTALALMASGQSASAQTDRSVLSPRTQGAQLRGLTAEDAGDLLTKLKQAQLGLRRGEALYFELLSGAPAAYAETSVSPLETFLSADFDGPLTIERLPPANSSWKPHRLTLLPDGSGGLVWDVEVVLGFYGDIARVEIFRRPPHPF